MSLNRNLNDAHPILKDAYEYSVREWSKRYPKANDPKVMLNEVHRTLEVQRAYYAQGRQPLAKINELRALAKLPAIGVKEAKKVVTKLLPGKSKHGLKPSRAIDALIIVFSQISNKIELYKEFADIMRDRQPSIVWGGDWDSDGKSDDEIFLDLAHYEI